MNLRLAMVRALVATVVAVAMDVVWLSLAGPKVYRPTVRAVQNGAAMTIDWIAAAAVYVFVFFGFLSLLFSRPEPEPAWKGAAFGAVVYGIYNLTNKAIFASYPWSTVLIDTAWGTVLFFVAAYVARRVGAK